MKGKETGGETITTKVVKLILHSETSVHIIYEGPLSNYYFMNIILTMFFRHFIFSKNMINTYMTYAINL